MELFNNKNSVKKKLSEVYKNCPQRKLLKNDTRIIIFSDHHRGDRGASDYFQRSEKVYNSALGYYLELGYELILAGDVEEFWECHPKKVFKSYPFTYELEKQFYLAGKFTKIAGNHDNMWRNPKFVQKYADPVFPGIHILDGIRIACQGALDSELINIFITHGHQGTFLNDTLDWFGKFWLRNFQKSLLNLFKQKYQTPAYRFALREEHEKTMLEWTENLNDKSEVPELFITGHTHHPVFIATHTLNRMKKNIANLKKSGTKKNKKLAAMMLARMEYYKADIGMELYQRNVNTRFFNTGCCSYYDGSISGIEISPNKIRLIRWSDEYNGASRMVLGSQKLVAL